MFASLASVIKLDLLPLLKEILYRYIGKNRHFLVYP
jgi:hypothetical protein